MDPSLSNTISDDDDDDDDDELILSIEEDDVLLARINERLMEVDCTDKKLTDSNIKVALQNLPPSISPLRVDYDLQYALRKRLRQMNNTRIDYSESPFMKLWFIFWINFIAQGLFGLFQFGGLTHNLMALQVVLWFTVFIVFFWVSSLISAHTRRKKERDFAWLKELEKNSTLVRHFSNLETARIKKKKQDFDRHGGYACFLLMFLMLILTVVLIYNTYTNKDSMEFTSFSIFFVLFLAINFGVLGMLSYTTDFKWKRRLQIIHSITIASFLFFIVYSSVSNNWPSRCFIWLFGVSAFHVLCSGICTVI